MLCFMGVNLYSRIVSLELGVQVKFPDIQNNEVLVVNGGIGGGLGLDVNGNDEEDEDARNLRKSPRRRQAHGHRSKLIRACATRVDTRAITYSKRVVLMVNMILL
ncbi:hypothetical protein F2Q70_00040913 [Brassica cretica]|uniref:Uncharacterized protein n=1 Tax=Brassica cretica TaxID=69181 RepID=A0A8S9K7H0_BRACR|nr:hypothetical protein F2Q70_00040913 [Brassica cretica]